jgi:hypothetical protein
MTALSACFLVGALLSCPPAEDGSAVAQETPPSLVVQLVDQTWMPVSGVTVDLREATGRASHASPMASATSNQEGLAHFHVPDQRGYVLTAGGHGTIFKKKTLKIRLLQHTKNRPTAHVQMRLDLVTPPLIYLD